MDESELLRKLVSAKRRSLGYSPQRKTADIRSAVETAMRGVLPEYSAAEIRIKDEWGLIAGEDIAKRSMPGEIVNGVLTLYVSGAVWLAELKNNRAADLLRLVNSHVGHGSVKRIEFRSKQSCKSNN